MRMPRREHLARSQSIYWQTAVAVVVAAQVAAVTPEPQVVAVAVRPCLVVVAAQVAAVPVPPHS